MDFVVFGSCYWDDPPGTPWRIAEMLARSHRTLYVEPPASYVHLRQPKRNTAWVRWMQGVRPHGKDLSLYIPPPSLPWKTRWPWSNALTARFHLPLLRRAVRRAGLARPVIFSFLPHHFALPERIEHSLFCYYAIDEWTALTRFIHPPTIRSYEESITRRADMVFTTAEGLAERLRTWNPRVTVVPNGANVEQFARAHDPALPVPGEIAELPHPVIGFSGVCDFRLHQELLIAVARQRPNWSFVFVGAIVARLYALRRLPNVHFVGHRSPDELSAYLKGFDAAIIPYAHNTMTRFIYPVKLNEYLAAGLPVVATRLPELLRVCGKLGARANVIVRLADSPQEFLAALDAAVRPESRTPLAVAERVGFARQNSWELRTEELLREVTLALELKDRSPRSSRVIGEKIHARPFAIKS
jgi:glycosyltransferase involved in cell wall biosynthesis